MLAITINLLLALAWASVTGSFSPINLAFGFVLSAVVLGLIREDMGSIGYFRRILRALNLAVIFLYELVKSSVTVAIIVLSPKRVLEPAIIAFPLSVKSDAEITLLANLITLTPGTLSIDVSDDRTTLYVHAIDAPDPDAIVKDIKDSFERRINKVFEA